MSLIKLKTVNKVLSKYNDDITNNIFEYSDEYKEHFNTWITPVLKFWNYETLCQNLEVEYTNRGELVLDAYSIYYEYFDDDETDKEHKFYKITRKRAKIAFTLLRKWIEENHINGTSISNVLKQVSENKELRDKLKIKLES